MGCAVSPAGRWRVTRQVALRIRYPKPSRASQGLRGLPGPARGRSRLCRAFHFRTSILHSRTYNGSFRNRPLMPLKASRPCFQIRNSALRTSFQAQTRSLFKIGNVQSGHHLKKRKASSHPQPKLAFVWSGQVQLADPNPIVQDWRHPVKAPSEEN